MLEALLSRMERIGQTTVPCPERDLIQDACLKSRKTVRTHLQRLQGLGYGERLATFTPGSDDPTRRSHTFVLDRRFSPAAGSAVRLVAPPTSHTPPPPSGLWRLLGLPARHTYLAVLAQPSSGRRELATAAGLVHGPGQTPTPAQLRTVEGHLSRIFAKLGVSRRSELLDAKPDGRHPVVVPEEVPEQG